ncbi:ABC transporter permease [Microbacterium sp. 179-I 3D4 NHS]|uniref:ABC transporter permease n=1 Tax=Microbacterium sp. 179-I 3D4 NHS TaxID=3142381 RepID=UPI0039A03427
MSTATASAPASVSPDARVRLTGVLRSEWIKFTSLRSTFWTTAVILVLWVGLATILAASADFGGMPDDEALRQYLAVFPATLGVQVGILVAGIQGVLAFSGEYSTGQIRSSLAAVPRRLPVLAAKSVVVFVWTFFVSLVGVFASWAVAKLLLEAKGYATQFDVEVLTALLGAPLFVALVALFGVGIGALVRSGAGGITIVVGVVLALPTVVLLLSGFLDWVGDLAPYLMTDAGSALTAIPGNPMFGDPALGPAEGLLTLAVWAAVSLAAGAFALKGRDA